MRNRPEIRTSAVQSGLLAALAALTLACAGPSIHPAAPQPRPVSTNSAAIEKARADSVQRPYTEADVRFVSAMIVHHAQAILVSRWAPPRGASAAIQRLAERVINAQDDEITLMQQWLADRGKPIPHGPHAHEMDMPGMLTEGQLRQLGAARGAEFDRLYLTLMIQHHRGAVEMVKQLLASTGAAQDLFVFKFASDVHVDQTTEIARMEQMLSQLTSPGNQP